MRLMPFSSKQKVKDEYLHQTMEQSLCLVVQTPDFLSQVDFLVPQAKGETTIHKEETLNLLNVEEEVITLSFVGYFTLN